LESLDQWLPSKLPQKVDQDLSPRTRGESRGSAHYQLKTSSQGIGITARCQFLDRFYRCLRRLAFRRFRRCNFPFPHGGGDKFEIDAMGDFTWLTAHYGLQRPSAALVPV
jgi:hypothetical protein